MGPGVTFAGPERAEVLFAAEDCKIGTSPSDIGVDCADGASAAKIRPVKWNMRAEEKANPDSALDSQPDVWSVVRQLLRHPLHSFIACWNWKAGSLSMILRVPIYVATTFKYGWQATTLAGTVEAVFSAGVAGVYAAFTEAVRNATPQAVVATLLLVVLPAITLVLDALFHYVMRTPNLLAGVLVSLVVSILSSAFNWYSMRRGTLLMGGKAKPFASDLASLPLLIARFVMEPFILLWRNLKLLCVPMAGD